MSRVSLVPALWLLLAAALAPQLPAAGDVPTHPGRPLRSAGTAPGRSAPAPAEVTPVTGVDYLRHVRPILERNCLACHACYDAPCQLKMEDEAGLDRGSSQEVVYAGARLSDQKPSQLHFDAPDTAAWRTRGFESVLEGGADSLLARMLALGRRNTMRPDRPIPDSIKTGVDRTSDCARGKDFDGWAKKHPQEGMPLLVAPLTDAEYATLQGWVAEGARLETREVPLAPVEASEIAAWEEFFNQRGLREQLVSRYLYEHLFLAHLWLETGPSRRPFEIVRSRTPPGTAIAPVEAVRPNSSPGGEFWYRLRPVPGTIVHKTHITYRLDAARRTRYRELFLAGDWTVERLPDYGGDESANPFATFAAIPAEARYRFMLDDSKYFVDTFIRGPVCRGQLATDVIEDHFFALFQDPATDRFLRDPEYASRQVPNLFLPGRENWGLGVLPPWLRSEMKYHHERNTAYDGERFDWGHLWQGEGRIRDALLTVFRHFDSATVALGLVGEVPETVWVMDYPLFERIYYVLVVNFNVFGSSTHQVATRLYFDTLRAEAEANFLRFLPAASRKDLHKAWYRGMGATVKRKIMYPAVDVKTPSLLDLPESDPKAAFVHRLLARASAIAGPPDHLNRCEAKPCKERGAPLPRAKVEAELQRLANVVGREAPFLLELPEITFLRVRMEDGADEAYTLTRDREHLNVAFMTGEDRRLVPEEDRLTLVRGPLGSYPNFIFVVPPGEITAFVDGLSRVRGPAAFAKVVEAFGIRRTHPRFWDHFHFFTEWMQRHDPHEAGVYDANRYANF